MRTLRFRGKAKATNKWVYGDLRQFPNGKCAIYTDDSDNPLSCPIVDAKTVGQYTNNRDLNGVQIYDGDFLLGYRVGESKQLIVRLVEYDSCGNLRCCRVPKYAFHDERDYCYVHEVQGRIIGNIHDNPEQLNITKIDENN